ncbi:MAG TPA: hypothetical protein VGN72_18905 [Tepidisphaeraceae bacterium]|jgi:hypothetical protein|nr:hypothetical protein [Tepidisphaeraceae bacterium]
MATPRDPRDYRVTIGTHGDTASAASGSTGAASAGTPASRPFLSVMFNCCRTYVRVYRSADGTHYAARCPKCAKSVRFDVADGGSESRSFVVD